MLPAGHDDRLSPLFDVQPTEQAVEAHDAIPVPALLGPRPRIFDHGKIIGHILPLIATTEEATGQQRVRSVQSVAYDEM